MKTKLVTLTPKMLAAAAIVRIAGNNANVTVASLRDELERGDIDGWMNLVTRYGINFSQWSGAMEQAIAVLEARAR